MRCVSVAMFNMTTFTGEFMSFADTKSTALAAPLRSVGGVDVIHTYAKPLSFVDASLCHHVEKPLRKLSASATALLPVFTDLLDPQVLKDKNSIGGNPLAKLGSGLATERSTPVALFATQPFQKSTNGFRILLLCLPVRQLFLKTLTCLTTSLIQNFHSSTRDEQSIFFCGGHQRVGGTKVYADRSVPFDIGNFKSETEVNFTAAKYSDAVIADSIGEICLSVIRNDIIKLFTSNRSGDGKLAVTSEAEVFGEKEKSGNSFEGESFGGWFTILSRRGISGSHIPDSRALHLGWKRGWNLVVGLFVKIKSGQWLTTIISYICDRLLKAVVFHNQIQKIGCVFNHKRYCSLYLHTIIIS